MTGPIEYDPNAADVYDEDDVIVCAGCGLCRDDIEEPATGDLCGCAGMIDDIDDLRFQILAILERNASLCMDNEEERQQLADALANELAVNELGKE